MVGRIIGILAILGAAAAGVFWWLTIPERVQAASLPSHTPDAEAGRRIFDAAGPRLAKRPQVTAISTAEYPTPARRPANSVLDCSKLTRVHGITLPAWEQSLDEMLAATLKAA